MSGLMEHSVSVFTEIKQSKSLKIGKFSVKIRLDY